MKKNWTKGLQIKETFKKISEAPSLAGVAFYFNDNHKFRYDPDNYRKTEYAIMGINKFYNNFSQGGSKFDDAIKMPNSDWGAFSLLRIKDFYKKLYGMSRKQFKKYIFPV